MRRVGGKEKGARKREQRKWREGQKEERKEEGRGGLRG